MKRVKSVLLRFTQHEFIQLQNYCQGLGIERSEMVREAIFKAITFHQQERESQQAKEAPEVIQHLQREKTVQDFLEELVRYYQDFAQRNHFERKIDCNVYRANVYEFNNLLTDYSQKALREEFAAFCTAMLSADFIASHLLRGFEQHVSTNFVFWNKHNRGSGNYVGY